MQFKSKAQQEYFRINRQALISKGVDVDRIEKENRGKTIPEYAEKNNEKQMKMRIK